MQKQVLDELIEKFLKENGLDSTARNRMLVRSGFLNCRDTIVSWLHAIIDTNSTNGKELTSEQEIALATFKSLADQLRSYGEWVYADVSSSDNNNNTSNSGIILP